MCGQVWLPTSLQEGPCLMPMGCQTWGAGKVACRCGHITVTTVSHAASQFCPTCTLRSPSSPPSSPAHMQPLVPHSYTKLRQGEAHRAGVSRQHCARHALGTTAAHHALLRTQGAVRSSATCIAMPEA